MDFLFAPMEGITYATFRKVHHELFPGTDAYYTPFIAPDTTGSFKPKFLRELTQDRSDTLHIVPQLLSNNAVSFVTTLGKLKDVGFEEVNLNAGCPSGTVFAKRKGSGMLADLSSFDAFLDDAFSGAEQLNMKISIKTRMGIHSTSEFPQILNLYLKYPLSRLIIHARDRDGLYKSEPDLSGFLTAFRQCRFPVTYNGNIFSQEELETVTALVPELSSVMLGRGAVANPALIRFLQGGAPLSVEELRNFQEVLIEAYLSGGLCEQFTLERMKQLWYYFIHMFSNCRKEEKTILKSRSLSEFRSSAEVLFRSGKFNEHGRFYQI